MKVQSGIYMIQSKIKPTRVYIGSSKNISERWRHHLMNLRLKRHHSPKLQAHYNKYGESDLQFSILLGCDIVDLISAEQYFIDSHNPWFNASPTASSRLGTKASAESKYKMRLAKLGKKQSKEHVAKRVKSIGTPWNKDKKATPEAIKHQSEAHKGKRMTQEQRERRSGVNHRLFGKKHSPETIQKMRDAAKGRVISEEQKMKIRNTLRGKKLSEEHRKNIGIGTRMGLMLKKQMKEKTSQLCN